MTVRFRRIFFVAVLLLALAAGFNLAPNADGRLEVPRAQAASQALNLWGDFFNPAVGMAAFDKVGLGRKDPRAIAANIVKILFGLLGTLAVVLIMYGGFVYMTAAGDMDKVERAKKIIRDATIGLLIILAAFSIAIYVLSRLIFATSGQKVPWGSGGGGGGSLGALGNGIIQSVYPAPEQRAVPRNTAIIITFREVMDPASLCDQVAAGRCAPGAKLLPASVRIFKTAQGDDDATNLTEVAAASNDNRTFVFSPKSYLGSSSEKVWYSVALTPDLKKANGQSAFSIGGFEWKFETSEKLDLTPPQILGSGVFPPPDNAQDTVGSVNQAVAAQGFIVVRETPRAYTAGSVRYVKTNPGSVEINVAEPAKNSCDGQLDIAINNTVPLTASLTYRDMAGKVNVPQASIVNREIATACNIKVELALNFQAGHSWRLTLTTTKPADFLTVGASRYTFVDANPGAGEIAINANQEVLAANIAQVLNNDPVVNAAAAGNKVTVSARSAGQAGNGIVLLSSADSLVLALTPLAGGADRAVQMNTVDKTDQPKNSVIQINFNEAINPLTASGPAAALANYLRVVNLSDGSRLAGEFVLSNQYQTLEFIPAAECGVNGCGEKIYCLPPASQLQVELLAASLAAVCTNDNDCAARTPFNACQGGICTETAGGAKYPLGQEASGLTDLANNSLDGNRDGKAAGPVSFYNENSGNVSAGDNYQWSFWVSDRLDLTPPEIIFTDAAANERGVKLNKEILIYFNKLMLSSSLTSGSIVIDNGYKQVTHKLINLWSVGGEALGYWVEKTNRETSAPPDNQPDETVVSIQHSQFGDSTVYRAQVGSGVKDIRQNCFKPCRGVGCQADDVNSSCCNGAPSQLNSSGNCP